VYNDREGLAQALESSCDLVIFDGMRPILDGFEVSRQLPRRSNIPVIMLKARAQERDRIEGLECGADDYIPQPSAPMSCWHTCTTPQRRLGVSLW
jgi:DNA-binding response OmpR family regulator